MGKAGRRVHRISLHYVYNFLPVYTYFQIKTFKKCKIPLYSVHKGSTLESISHSRKNSILSINQKIQLSKPLPGECRPVKAIAHWWHEKNSQESKPNSHQDRMPNALGPLSKPSYGIQTRLPLDPETQSIYLPSSLEPSLYVRYKLCGKYFIIWEDKAHEKILNEQIIRALTFFFSKSNPSLPPQCLDSAPPTQSKSSQ